jgi:hypothetical protein
MVIDKNEKGCHVLELKRALERYGGAQEKARQRAELQHNDLVQRLDTVLEGANGEPL